jgi:hypothetical protein
VITLGTGSCTAPPAPGDVVTLSLSGVTNAATLHGTSVTLATSADPAAISTPVP